MPRPYASVLFRSYCILRNCVKVSELLQSVNSNVYELVRRDNMAEYVTSRQKGASETTEANSSPVKGEDTERSRMLKRLRPRGRVEQPKRQNNSRLKRISPRKQSERESNKLRENEIKDEVTTMTLRRPLSDRRRLRQGDPKVGNPHEKDVTICRSRRSSPTPSLPTVITRSRKRKLDQVDGEQKLDSTIKVRKSTRRQTNFASSTAVSHKKEVNSRMCKLRGKMEGRRRRASSPANKNSTKSPGATVQSDKPEELATLTFDEWEKRNSACYCNEESCHGARSDRSCGSSKLTTSELMSQTLSGGRARCKSMQRWNNDADWVEPEFVQYRQIAGWPHLNECVRTLEVLNIGGTNVLGEFIPFILLNCPWLKSLGQWLNTSIYGLEILRKLPGQERAKFPVLMEISYSTDRNYFCQPYIGFVPESKDFL